MKKAQQNRIHTPVPGVKISVLDLQAKKVTIYKSMHEVTLALGISISTLSRRIRLNIKKAYRKRYIIEKFHENHQSSIT
jgi:hypothetical protein